MLIARFIARAASLVAAFTIAASLSAAAAAPADALVLKSGIQIQGVDLHDGQILKVGSTYYFYGTRYSCGYQWYYTNTPFCGFGVSTSTDLQHWSAIKTLFAPRSSAAADNWANRAGKDWQYVCGGTGQGCFNPRMVVNRYGVPVLWFNAPRDFSDFHTNAYYSMGCNSLTGPCGRTAGAPHGSTRKPSLRYAAGNGDFSLFSDSTGTWMIGTEPSATGLSVEKLDAWDSGSAGVGVNNIAGIAGAEGPGLFRGGDGRYYATYSDPNGGYPTGTNAGYAVAPAPSGPWTAPANLGVNAPTNGRRTFSTACGGQPRGAVNIDGSPYELIDLWTGSRNETQADTYLAPLVTRAASGTPGDGRLWRAPLAPFSCE